ncbi:hypothetical protein [Allochromatium vinosum]|uniref:Uncharacterized protein n=1 Tax=Allochromatium vinosum (strain ATCC 17899 / DSM 180 / NBRC 103801 / NCIMB 10441 / D) TaxID=572477 RepID=D3RQY8_ALLVD|nr:hypothetical protein [Allochromatium vinosum]ADC61816.1 hypothetical protein Alvin_0870 [Allochromatium vinosum DSM 180]
MQNSDQCRYGKRPRPVRSHPADRCRPCWSTRLPLEWHDRVVPPSAFRVFREFEVQARRVLGYDASGQLCYSAHDYQLFDPRSDDDEDFYPALTYGESVTAWRLTDGRWLVHRQQEPLGEEAERIDGFTLESHSPR